MPVVDTTGTEDSFFGSMLYQIIETSKELEDNTKDEIERYIAISHATAALCIQNVYKKRECRETR